MLANKWTSPFRLFLFYISSAVESLHSSWEAAQRFSFDWRFKHVIWNSRLNLVELNWIDLFQLNSFQVVLYFYHPCTMTLNAMAHEQLNYFGDVLANCFKGLSPLSTQPDWILSRCVRWVFTNTTESRCPWGVLGCCRAPGAHHPGPHAPSFQVKLRSQQNTYKLLLIIVNYCYSAQDFHEMKRPFNYFVSRRMFHVSTCFSGDFGCQSKISCAHIYTV